MHTLVGAGKTDGAMDAANLIKPALARGELHCIGATTLDEYRKYVEKDAALARRFQPLMVEEPTVEDTSRSCAGIKEKYELHHGVRIRTPRWWPPRRSAIATSPTGSCPTRPST
jgi:ATP-dependent Clp protease ATP-binding subunit ClpB